MKNIIEYNIGENRKLILRQFRQNGGFLFFNTGGHYRDFFGMLILKNKSTGQKNRSTRSSWKTDIFYSARNHMLHRCPTNLMGGPAIGRPSDQSHAAGSRARPGSLQNCKDESTDSLRKIQ